MLCIDIFKIGERTGTELYWFNLVHIMVVDVLVVASPGHQQPWHWLSRLGRSLSYLREDFNYMCHISAKEWHKMQIYVLFTLKNVACKGLFFIGSVDWYASICSLSLTAQPVLAIGVAGVLNTFYKYKSMLYAYSKNLWSPTSVSW